MGGRIRYPPRIDQINARSTLKRRNSNATTIGQAKSIKCENAFGIVASGTVAHADRDAGLAKGCGYIYVSDIEDCCRPLLADVVEWSDSGELLARPFSSFLAWFEYYRSICCVNNLLILELQRIVSQFKVSLLLNNAANSGFDMREDVEDVNYSLVESGQAPAFLSSVPIVDDFKTSMRNLAASVAVVTARAGNDAAGLTATSIVSFSMDPPTLLVSVNRSSSFWPLVKASGRFAVSLLSVNHREIADTFAGRRGLSGNDRYVDERWRHEAGRMPHLVDAVAVIECELDETIERYSHAILIGRVSNASSASVRRPLLYWQGEYNELCEK